MTGEQTRERERHGSVPGTVVVGVDGSDSAGRAIDWAIDQAVAEHRSITLAHAVVGPVAVWHDRNGDDHRVGLENERTEAQRVLEEARAEVARRAPGLEVHEVQRVVDPRDLLLELSDGAAMVVLGSRGRGPVRSLLLGSVGVAVTRHAKCPVVVMRPGNPGLVRQGVVVGADGTELSVATLEFAYRQASLRRLPLTVLHCVWDAEAATAGSHIVAEGAGLEEQRMLLAESMSGMTEKFPDVHVRSEIARGMPDDCLVRLGERMNLVVVGAHHGGAASSVLFGSVAASVVEHATCPVAVVPLTHQPQEVPV
jgi:nucleotide-binding universal stress UspA family protein